MSDDRDRRATPERAKPAYEPPRIVAYDQDDLMDRIGPAVACARWDPAASEGESEPDDEDL
jgi:hypothetical protein